MLEELKEIRDSTLLNIHARRTKGDKGLTTGILLNCLTISFDCISHDLLFAKLHAYRFSKTSLYLIFNYLSGRNQRIKINNCLSTWLEIIYGEPQGSILGPLIFNIYINDFSFSANFADENTPYDFGTATDEVMIS